MPGLPKAFAELFDSAQLAAASATLVAIDPEGAILWLNPAWYEFARQNAGEAVLERFDVGANYFDGIAPPLRDFYQETLARVWSEKRIFEQDYECSTPDIRRYLHLRVLPVSGAGLLLEHSLTIETPNTMQPCPAEDVLYRMPDGVIVQCSNCRRTRRADQSGWDWVPQWVKKVPETMSHGLCEVCVGFYWGRFTRRR